MTAGSLCTPPAACAAVVGPFAVAFFVASDAAVEEEEAEEVAGAED
jgi:hypothetical protein